MVAPPSIYLQIALRHTFILEAAFFKNTARCGVFGQAGSFDPRKIHLCKSMVDQGKNGFAHIAAAGKRRTDPIAKRSGLNRTAADIVQRDRTQKLIVGTPHQHQGESRALRFGPLRPIDPIGKGAA